MQLTLFFSAQDIVIDKLLLESKDFSGVNDEDAALLRPMSREMIQETRTILIKNEVAIERRRCYDISIRIQKGSR